MNLDKYWQITNPVFIQICIYTLAFIGSATVFNAILLSLKPKNQTFKKVKDIIKGWWLIIGLLLLSLGLAPLGLVVGFFIFSLIAVKEYLSHSELNKMRILIFQGVLVSTLFQYLCLWQSNWSLYFAMPYMTFLISFSLVTILTAKIDKLPLVFSSLIGITLINHFLSYLPALFIWQLNKSDSSQALILVALVIFLTEINDVLQFIGGKSFGKSKIVPAISPNKTGGGFITGFIGTILMAGGSFNYFLLYPIWKSVAVGAIISVMGIVGDLTFSAIKRYLGTKDFSNALPGHGGVLDRLDSLIFTAPMVFYLIYFT